MDKRPHYTDTMDTRIPPSAIEIEEALLGCLLNQDSEMLITVQNEMGTDPGVFYKPAHQLVYQAIIEIDRKGSVPDLLLVENKLKDMDQLENVGGVDYLVELSGSAGTPNKAEEYSWILMEKWMKREMLINNNKFTAELYDPSSDPYDVLDKSMTSLDKIAGRLYKKQGMFVSDMLKDTLSDIEYRMSNPGIHGVPSGYALDKYTGGWQKGNLYIIAARPSMGKTAFALNGAFNAALFQSERFREVVFYSNMEMKNSELIARRLALESGVNSIKMRDGKLNKGEFKLLIKAAEKLFETKFIIDDSPSPNIQEWRAKVKSSVHRHGVGIAFVDYLQLMSGKQDGNREQEISSISRGLKATAKECNIPVVALSQLTRECEKRPGGEPFLSDLRESGSLEQDADGVIFINRPEFLNHSLYKEKPTKGKAWIKVAKMRQGMTGEFTMNFNKNLAMFTNEGDGHYSSNEYAVSTPQTAPQPHTIDGEDDAPF